MSTFVGGGKTPFKKEAIVRSCLISKIFLEDKTITGYKPKWVQYVQPRLYQNAKYREIQVSYCLCAPEALGGPLRDPGR